MTAGASAEAQKELLPVEECGGGFFQRSAGDVRVGPTLFRLARLYARARAECEIPGRERNRPDFMPFGAHSSTRSSLSRCDGRIREAKRGAGVFREVCSSSGSHFRRGDPGKWSPGSSREAPEKLPEVLENTVTGGLQSSRREL